MGREVRALPVPAQIVLNGYRGRSFMTWEIPLGQATVLPREDVTIYAAPVEEGILAVFTLFGDRGFDFRLTRSVIDAEGFETGSGQCSDPAAVADTASGPDPALIPGPHDKMSEQRWIS